MMKLANVELNSNHIGKVALYMVGLVMVAMLVLLCCVHFKTTTPPMEVATIVTVTLLTRLLQDAGFSILKRPILFLALLFSGLVTVNSAILTLMWVAVKTAV